jgi:uncharacterized iron-regulated protein
MQRSPKKIGYRLTRLQSQNQAAMKNYPNMRLPALAMFCGVALISGCAMQKSIPSPDTTRLRQPGTILNTASGQTVSFDELIEHVADKQVVYVGERHNDPEHHAIQLRIVQALDKRPQPLSVGMEMFDFTYQDKLDQWSAGAYEWEEFLKQSHWYANWKFDDSLYQDILMYVQTRSLKLIGLNIPFCLPSKIAIGGLDSLSNTERAMLPDRIDTTNPLHRAYVMEIYQMHHHFKGTGNFEYFYEAQCAWEDGMARAIAENLQAGTMVVLAGNGHIVEKFGIPDRAYARTSAPFSTVYLAYPEEEITAQTGDFIWFTSKKKD